MTTTYLDAEASVRKFLYDNWQIDSNLRTPIAWPGVAIDTNNNYISFIMSDVNGFQSSFGDPSNNLFRKDGRIDMSVFTKGRDRDKNARTYASDLVNIFEGRTIGDVRIVNAYATNEGITEEDFYNIDIFLNYYYYSKN